MAPNIPLRTFSAAELSAATSDFSPSSLLGRGSHSTVHLAVLDSGRLLAAAKLPSPSSSPSISAHEISLLSSLPRTPFLVNLVGVSSSIAVVDLMPLGSLHLHLHQSPPLPFPRRLSLALRAAMAVDSLHRLGIAHRDLKPTNLLLDSLGRPRLADFGLAARLADADLPPPAGTLGYLDPSYVKPSDLSTKTDVYSFGVILFEILSGRRGFDVEYSPPALVEWAAPLVAEGNFDEIWEKGAGTWKGRAEEEAARMVAEVAARCVGEEAVARPEMEEVVGCLREARRRARPRAAAMAAAWRRVGKWVHGLARNGKVSDVAP